MLRLKFEGLTLLLVVTSSFALSACGNQGVHAVGPSAKSGSFSQGVEGSAPPMVVATGSSGTTPSNNPTSGPLVFNVSGMGNHAQHICVPAQSKLILRAMPKANSQPLAPPTNGAILINSKNNQLMYDGSPANYTRLRVAVSLPGRKLYNNLDHYDLLANVGSYSPAADLSPYLGAVTVPQIADTGWLSTPEYNIDTQTIYGSSAYDGICTYWESQLHGCTLSSQLRASEAATCAAGTQKVLINAIVSDYPCNIGDPTGWCKGGSIQTVPDYQPWSVQIQVMTENTSSFL